MPFQNVIFHKNANLKSLEVTCEAMITVSSEVWLAIKFRILPRSISPLALKRCLQCIGKPFNSEMRVPIPAIWEGKIWGIILILVGFGNV